MNLKHYIIRKLGGMTKDDVNLYYTSRDKIPEAVFYGTSYSKLSKDIKQEDLNNWYKRKDEKDKE